MKTWTKKHGLKLAYKMNGRRHRYLPDILVEYKDGRKFLEEVKGKVWNMIQFSIKNVAASSWCITHGMTFRIIFREHLELVD